VATGGTGLLPPYEMKQSEKEAASIGEIQGLKYRVVKIA
jgi:hypothetical protein